VLFDKYSILNSQIFLYISHDIQTGRKLQLLSGELVTRTAPTDRSTARQTARKPLNIIIIILFILYYYADRQQHSNMQ